MNGKLGKSSIVLLGLGHTNAHIVRMWGMSPIPDAQLICISNFDHATYSGMLPGTLAGLYPKERMTIDLVRLCASVGACFIRAELAGLDLDDHRVLLNGRPPIAFDILSVGIGSIPVGMEKVSGALPLVPIKPMQTFMQRFDQAIHHWAAKERKETLRVAVVGAGAAGIEIAMAVEPHVKSLLGNPTVQVAVIDRRESLRQGFAKGLQKRIQRELNDKGIKTLLGKEVQSVADDHLIFTDGEQYKVDIVLWATSATGAPLLAKLGLPVDGKGFLLTRPTLQTVGDAAVFAVGDTGTLEKNATPKAGVYAVRHGPILWENMQRIIRGEPLLDYHPQRKFLKLLSTGDGRAILHYKGMNFSGAWCWKIKNRIDSRFMDKYQAYSPPMLVSDTAERGMEEQMRCAGCGGKVGGTVLRRVLKRLQITDDPRVKVGLEDPDDAAIVEASPDRQVVATVDFFTSPLADPYLVGRIAALNAASDLFAVGAKPSSALAIVVLPTGSPGAQEEFLFQALSGSLEEFKRINATLVGGHTIEGEQFTIGFTMLGDLVSAHPLTKQGLTPGDLLVLTKPLGTGALLAAHMQATCQATWYEKMLDSMLTSNAAVLDLVEGGKIQGMTDVTGFGLAGHLHEMLQAAQLSAQIDLKNVPLLAGFPDVLEQGIESTLTPANRDVEQHIQRESGVGEKISKDPLAQARYAAIFDPQTSGGLLLSIRQENAQQVIDQLHASTGLLPSIIGNVVEARGEPTIHIS